MMIRTFVSLLVGACVFTSTLRAEENPVFTTLTEQGVSSGETTIKLPAPALASGLDAKGQRAAIEKLLEGRNFDDFVKKGLRSPHIYKSKNTGDMWQIDAYFIAYGDLEALLSDGFVAAEDFEFGPKAKEAALKSDVIPLEGEKLSELGIVRVSDFDNYNAVKVPIFERVRLTATIRMFDTREKNSVLVAARIDERFDKHSAYQNYWQTIAEEKDKEGKAKLVIGEKKTPYHAAGGYAKATQLDSPEGAIFVEYHVVFAEPAGWFNGAKILAAKLPIGASNNIQKLRTQLAKEEAARGKSNDKK